MYLKIWVKFNNQASFSRFEYIHKKLYFIHCTCKIIDYLVLNFRISICKISNVLINNKDVFINSFYCKERYEYTSNTQTLRIKLI